MVEDDAKSGDQKGEERRPDDESEGDRPQQLARGALLVVAAGTVVAFLSIARSILVPVVLAVFLAYVLDPLVQQLCRIRVPHTDLRLPRSVAASAVVVFAVVVFGGVGVALGEQVRQLGMQAPRYADRIAEQVGEVRQKIEELEQYFDEFVQPIRPDRQKARPSPVPSPPETDPGANSEGPDPSGAESDEPGGLVDARPDRDPPPIQRPPDERPIIIRSGSGLWSRIYPYLTGGLTGLLGIAVQRLTVVFVLFFVLVQAPAFKEKLLTIGGTTDARREAILDALEDVHRDVQGYLFGRTLINAGLAVAIALSFFIYGLDYSLLLGILGGLLNFIPYFGAVVGILITGVVAYLQFGLLSASLTTMFIYFALTSVEGNLVTPITLSRQLELNSLAVLLGLIFWGWLWGPIGMLLAIPILAVFRVVGEHVQGLEPLAELLRG